MNVQPVLTGLEAAVNTQLAVAGDHPAAEAAAAGILEALEPALRQAALELARQAAAEVAAQLDGQRVEVIVTEGDPTLRVMEASSGGEEAAGEEYEARITLRLPRALKGLVEDAAGQAGDSVNSWVVKALSARARGRKGPGTRLTGTYDL